MVHLVPWSVPPARFRNVYSLCKIQMQDVILHLLLVFTIQKLFGLFLYTIIQLFVLLLLTIMQLLLPLLFTITQLFVLFSFTVMQLFVLLLLIVVQLSYVHISSTSRTI